MPSDFKPIVWLQQAATATIPPNGLAWTCSEEFVVVPLPSCPEPLYPQSQTVPSDLNATLRYAPPAMVLTPARLLTWTGTFDCVWFHSQADRNHYVPKHTVFRRCAQRGCGTSRRI